MSSLDSPTTTRPRHRLPRRQLIAASVGNALEWYDWTIFGLFSIYFAHQFFPAQNENLALLNTAATYALAFFFRPLGGLLLGRFADVKGRRPALLLTIVLMGGGTALIGLLPTYAQLGAAAPALLVLARISQGLSVGGEAANSNAYLAEIAPPDHRGRYGSFFQMSTATAVLLASLTAYFLSTLLGREAMQDYGWRIPFLVGGALAVLGILLRRTLAETELFQEHKPTAVRIRSPLLSTLRRSPRSVALVICITTLSTLAFYTFFAAVTPFATRARGADASTVFLALSIATAIYAGLQYPMAKLSDHIGRRPVLMIGSAGLAITIVPLSLLIGPDFIGLLTCFVVGLAFYSMVSSLLPAVMSELFPTELRGLGIGAWYNFTVAVFGGTAPLILTALTAAGYSVAFFWYVATSGVVMFLTVLLALPETRGQELA